MTCTASLVEAAPDTVYLALGDPLAPFMNRTVTFVVRSARVGAPGFLAELQKAMWSVDGMLPLANVQTMAAYYERAMERTTLTLLLGVTAGMAFLLGVIGIHGVTGYIVSLRASVTARDPAAHAPVTAVLGLAALCAGYLPARRVAGIDPALALRAE